MTNELTNRRINCPKCDTRLVVPVDGLSPYIRCGACGALMHSDCDMSLASSEIGNSDAGPTHASPLDSEHIRSADVTSVSTPQITTQQASPSAPDVSNPYLNATSALPNGSRSDESIYLGPETESDMFVLQDTRQRTAGTGLRFALVAILIGVPVLFLILSVSSYSKSSRAKFRKILPFTTPNEFMYTTADMAGRDRLAAAVTLSQWRDEATYPKREIDLTETLKDDPLLDRLPPQTDSVELSGKTWSEGRYLAIENARLLKKLKYSNGLITPRLAVAIQNKSLFELHLINCEWERNGAIRFTHPGYRKLFKLILVGTPLTRQMLNDLTVCYQLEELSLQQTNVGDFAIESINDFVRLKKLHLSDTKVTRSGLRKLRSKSLEELTISSTELTQKQRRLIKQNNPNLKRLVSSSKKD